MIYVYVDISKYINFWEQSCCINRTKATGLWPVTRWVGSLYLSIYLFFSSCSTSISSRSSSAFLSFFWWVSGAFFARVYEWEGERGKREASNGERGGWEDALIMTQKQVMKWWVNECHFPEFGKDVKITRLWSYWHLCIVHSRWRFLVFFWLLLVYVL